MPRTKVTFDTVREIGLALPDVEDSTVYGAFALKVRGNLLACRAINKSAEPNTLAIRIDFEQRDALLAEAPETYYVTDHYRNYPSVLVRLSHVGRDELHDLLNAAWRYVTSKAQKSARPSRAVGAKTAAKNRTRRQRKT